MVVWAHINLFFCSNISQLLCQLNFHEVENDDSDSPTNRTINKIWLNFNTLKLIERYHFWNRNIHHTQYNPSSFNLILNFIHCFYACVSSRLFVCLLVSFAKQSTSNFNLFTLWAVNFVFSDGNVIFGKSSSINWTEKISTFVCL